MTGWLPIRWYPNQTYHAVRDALVYRTRVRSNYLLVFSCLPTGGVYNRGPHPIGSGWRGSTTHATLNPCVLVTYTKPDIDPKIETHCSTARLPDNVVFGGGGVEGGGGRGCSVKLQYCEDVVIKYMRSEDQMGRAREALSGDDLS